jgi:hypothetical protein
MLAQILQIRCLVNQLVNLLVNRESLILLEVSASQFLLDAFKHFQCSLVLHLLGVLIFWFRSASSGGAGSVARLESARSAGLRDAARESRIGRRLRRRLAIVKAPIE